MGGEEEYPSKNLPTKKISTKKGEFDTKYFPICCLERRSALNKIKRATEIEWGRMRNHMKDLFGWKKAIKNSMGAKSKESENKGSRDAWRIVNPQPAPAPAQQN